MTLLDFSGWRRPHADWSNQQLAEFYRVESALIQAQIPVEIDRGVTDEGDPWLVFAHVETGDIVVHFARERGSYIAAVPSIPWTARGSDLRALIAEFMQSHPVLLPTRAEKKSNVLLHPGALFTAFVATAFYLDGFRVSDAQAGNHKATAPHQTGAGERDADAAGEREYISKIALLAAVVIALGAGRDQAAGLISGLLSEPSPDGSVDDIKALLAGLSDTRADVPPALENSSESSSKSAPLAAVVSVDPTDGEVGGYQRASVRSDNSNVLTAGASVEATSSGVEGGASVARPLTSEQTSTGVAEQAPPETSGSKVFAGSSVPSAQFVGGEGATAATAAAVLAFVLETAPQTLTPQAGMLLVDQVISWVEQIVRAPQGGQSLADALNSPASAEWTSSAPSIQSVVFDDAIRLDLVSQFLKSDTDIVTFVGQAAIVIYDTSDLASGAGDIEIQTWQLSDAQSVSLIGSSAFFDHFYAPHLA